MGRLHRGGQPLLALAGILAEHGESALFPRNHLEQGWFPGGDLFLSTLDGVDNIGRLLNPLTVTAKPFRHLRIITGEKLKGLERACALAPATQRLQLRIGSDGTWTFHPLWKRAKRKRKRHGAVPYLG